MNRACFGWRGCRIGTLRRTATAPAAAGRPFCRAVVEATGTSAAAEVGNAKGQTAEAEDCTGWDRSVAGRPSHLSMKWQAKICNKTVHTKLGQWFCSTRLILKVNNLIST